MVYTPNNIPFILDHINGTLALVHALGIDTFIGKLVTKGRILLGFEARNVDTTYDNEQKKEIIKYTPEQRNKWQDGIKNIESLLEKLKTVYSELSTENQKLVKWSIDDFKDYKEEIERLSKQDSCEKEKIERINQYLEYLPKDLEESIDHFNQEGQKIQKNNSKQCNSSYSSNENLVHSMSASYINDNPGCSYPLNYTNEQNIISIGDITSSDSIEMFNTSEYLKKVA